MNQILGCAAATPQNQVTRGDRHTLFAMNRDLNTAAIFNASCFEELQAMFRVGILLPDGTQANGIGRCKSPADFYAKAQRSGTRIQSYE